MTKSKLIYDDIHGYMNFEPTCLKIIDNPIFQRLRDIMKQLNAQINSLRKQAEQAETYKNISEEITQLEGIVMYLKWYNLKDSFEKSDENLKDSEDSIQKFME